MTIGDAPIPSKVRKVLDSIIREVGRSLIAMVEPIPKSDDQQKPLKLNLLDWNIWHDYSTYFLEDIEDLHEVAKSLVKSGLCQVVYHSNDVAYWYTEKSVKSGRVSFKNTNADSWNTAMFSDEFKEVSGENRTKDNAYIMECTLQAVRFRNWEGYVSSFFVLQNVSYIRGFLTPIYFIKGGSRVSLYPQIKLFNNGVIILSFRMIAPDRVITSSDFVERYLNLYQHPFEDMKVPPSLIELDHKNLYLAPLPLRSIRSRWVLARLIWKLQEEIPKHIEVDETEDFTFKAVSTDPHKMPLNLSLP